MGELRLYTPEECGRDGYPFDWHTEIKHEVRDAAGNRCVRCLHPYMSRFHGNGQWSPCDERCVHHGPIRWQDPTVENPLWLSEPETPRAGVGVERGWVVEAEWRILTVHHLDGNKLNCRWWNLAALCQRCHLTIQGRVKMEQVYPFEHSDWFKPYAAGYYAFTYLGEELDREQTMARLDELLGLELAA